MENRKKGLFKVKSCRFCLSQDEPLTSLFQKKQASENAIPLSLKILSSISVEVFPSQNMPPYICGRCTFFMDVMYTFKNICREADKSILDFVQTGAALEPIVWPPSLVKLFHYGSKPVSDVNVMKVEGGATVEVSQGMSDSEDDEENVYNIKIGEGSEEVTSACVKVVTSKETEKAPRAKPKKDCDDIDAELAGGDARPAGLQDGCWACDQCDCTYPLQQLLELHKMQKHRARDISCDECDAKFISKTDLSIHMQRHSRSMPFECVACEKKFKRLMLLKRHEKLMHSDLPQHKCSSCPASFLSEAECEAHQARHRFGERNYACQYCDKRFYEQSALQKHKEVVHETKPMHSCEYCPMRFTSIPKLARHVRSHAGARAYPCKYCDKTFTKSHHYTRHLRLKHSNLVEELRCEQCSVAFQSQDELIYHSAIHATQNLTCPLCQEKFADVDAVTAHIKSHVTGMEFMCDFCELVFTTKEKLDLHIDNMHDDELRHVQDLGQDDTSMEMDAEGEDDDENSINVKEVDGHMVVEIKKPNEFMLQTTDTDFEEKMNYTNSEESESECAPQSPAPSPRPAPPARLPPLTPAPVATPPARTPSPAPSPALATNTDAAKHTSNNNLTASILRKAEEIKRKVQETPTKEKKEKSKAESIAGGANDKSLRLLEKELQELQRTNKRDETPKPSVKQLETVRSRGRPPIHTSTPKLKSGDEKKSITPKSTQIEKKAPERRAVKENKKPEDSKETKVNNVSAKEPREDKEAKANVSKEESKDKSVVKNGNGGSNKSSLEEPVRRSSRPSKVKDYAKMVNHRPVETTPSDDDSDDDEDEEYVEEDKSEARAKSRRSQKVSTPKQQTVKSTPATPATPVTTKKRGRPRKDAGPAAVPAKVKKADDEESEDSKSEKMETEDSFSVKTKEKPEQDLDESKESDSSLEASKPANAEQKPSNLLVAPTGQTLKKVPIKSLPPGVRPLPLPATARPKGAPELCEMQIGKKMVKVQKIVMTKAEVEAMAKKGLVEMKDGTMVLKPGVKIPTDPTAIKSSLVGEKSATKESQVKATPTRCEFEDA